MITLDKYEGVNCIRTYPLDGYITSTLRFTDKENNQAERMVYSNYWREQIDMFGQKVLYYRNNYNLLSADNFYGEHPLAGFESPKAFIMGIQLSENALLLSKFGYRSDDTVTGFIHISSFYSVYPTSSEPKAGDVFKLVEYGSDRPGERDGKMFEITERIDEDNSAINPLMGHYVWQIKAKRFEYSYEPNIIPEKGLQQVHDSNHYGTLSSSNERDESIYPGDVDKLSKDKVFDMSQNNTLAYGGYY
jgi:hypothetical protein